MTPETLFRAIGSVNEEFLEHSERTVKPIHWRAWMAAAACLCIVLLGHWVKPSQGAVKPNDLLGGECGCQAEFPGGIDPVLMVNGRSYHWCGISKISSSLLYKDENGKIGKGSYLPDGFEAVGEISSVTTELPKEDLQIQAGIPITGTVYTNPEAPLVVYACVDTDWLEDCYIRFVNEAYRTGMIRFEGRLYWFDPVGDGYTVSSERLEELPEGCVSAGKIQGIVWDRYPENELEINDVRDSYGKSVWGREVFRNPADDSVIYLYEEQYWRGGSNPAWRACHLWEES